MSPPVVLHVFESWAPVTSGYVTRSRRIVEHQRALGIAEPVTLVSSRQHVLAGHADGAEMVPPSARERRVRRVRPHDVDSGHLARAGARKAAEVGAEVVHGHFSSGIGQGIARGARMAGLPFVSEIRFDLAGAMASASGNPLLHRMEPLLRRIFERHHRHAGAVVSASHALKGLVERLAPGVPVFVAANGADIPADPDAVARAGRALRVRLGIADRIVVGTATNMLAYEGLDRLAPALRGVPGITLLMVGKGPALAGLRDQAAALGIPAVFPGEVPAADVPAHIAALDIFAIPRRNATVTAYASPLKLAEAMAQGSAVVATDQGDIAHMLRDDHGLVVAPDDDAALAAALRRLAGDAPLRDLFRARTRDRAASEMTWEGAIEVYRDVYDHVLDGHRGKAP